MMHTADKRASIRFLNDLVRNHPGLTRIAVQPAFVKLDRALQHALVDQMGRAPIFDHVADTDGEHCCGYARLAGAVLSWQILSYDAREPGYCKGSPDRANPRLTRRVLLLDVVDALPPHLTDSQPVSAPAGQPAAHR